MNLYQKSIQRFFLGLVLIAGTNFSVMAQPENETNTNVTESGNTDEARPRDNFYDRYLYTEKRVVTYDFIHEKDVFWERRIWRLINM